MPIYITQNGPMPTTSPLSKVATGTSSITLLQVAAGVRPIRVIRWGCSFDAASNNTGIQVGLLATDQPATVTAHVASGIKPWGSPGGQPDSQVVLGTISTGYTATSEGSPTQTYYGDIQIVQPNGSYVQDFHDGKEFVVPAGYYLRIRVTASASVGAYCYVVWKETVR